MPSRRRLLQTLAALPLALPFAASIPGVIRQALAAGDSPIRSGLQKIRGDVRVNGQPARIGMLIQPGDRIETGAASEAIYVVGRDAYLQRAETSVELRAGSARQLLRLLRGALLAVFARGAHTIETPTATIGIRGTGCYLEGDAERMYFCLCYGEADLVPRAGVEKSERLSTTHHEAPRWISARDAMQPITPAPMINHSDAELILLEALVGRQPPFPLQGSRY